MIEIAEKIEAGRNAFLRKSERAIKLDQVKEILKSGGTDFKDERLRGMEK